MRTDRILYSTKRKTKRGTEGSNGDLEEEYIEREIQRAKPQHCQHIAPAFPLWPDVHTSLFYRKVEDQAQSSFLAETVVYSTLLRSRFVALHAAARTI